MSGHEHEGGVEVYRHWCREHRTCEAEDGTRVFRVCWECGHAYPTPESLEDDFAATTGRAERTPHVLIIFCPTCLCEFPR